MEKKQLGSENDKSDGAIHSSDNDESKTEEPPPKEENLPEASGSTSDVKKSGHWLSGIILCACCSLAVAVVLQQFYRSSLSSLGSARDVDEEINRYIHLWGRDYPNQHHDTWGTVAGQLSQFAGIANVSPLVIVLAYSEGYKTTMLLASEISHAALQLIDDPDKCGDTDAAKLSGGDSKVKGEYLLTKQLPQIRKCRKMIMMNLEKLDGNAAKGLHSMLDPDFPNIPSVVYILTVKIPSPGGNVYREVRQVLTSKWSDKLDDDRVNALLSRLVNNVEVIPEPAFE